MGNTIFPRKTRDPIYIARAITATTENSRPFAICELAGDPKMKKRGRRKTKKLTIQ
jgi:hypothetical protein